MSVAGIVNGIPGAAGTAFNAFAATCHFATSYWLYSAEFGSAPTLLNYQGGVNLTGLVNEMLPHGTKMKRPGHGAAIAVPTGTVLVFSNNGNAGHSCIVRADGLIGGYNQENWFTTPGQNHRYSQHSLGDIEWANASRARRPALNHPYDLFAVPEVAGRAAVRSQFQR